MSVTLTSVNIGEPRSLAGHKGKTGIFKQPAAGTVTITADGLEGDAVMDRKHHGGDDQAVYCYFADDYAWWSDELGRAIGPGTFGENLTISGVEGVSVGAGDRFTIGAVVLEVTAHRTPCSTLARRMEDKTFVKRFMAAGRPGAYLRVIEGGAVEAGMEIVYAPFEAARFTVAEMLALEGKRSIDPAVMVRGLKTPIHHQMREDFERRLAGNAR